MKTTPAQEMKTGRSRGRVTQVDQMNSSPRLREIQQASQILAQTLEIRETMIVALRRDIESGHYSIKADQVAEKIMQDHLLALFSS
ncbi:MAG: flagellar biosynthesis anti-sigma factor FlgM [Candidatus Entotheonellia bacterium]